MINYISEIISAILGFIAGGSTIGIIMHIKHNRLSNKQQGDNIASSGGVAAGSVQGNIVITNSPQISENTPVYVAGFERGVLPIGDWSISITLSKCSIPSIFFDLPGMV